MKIKSNFIIAISTVTVLISCMKNREDDVIGMYKTSYNDNGSHELQIKSDHTFIQKFSTNDTIIELSGSWKLDKDGDLEVTPWTDLNKFGDNTCHPCSFNLLFVDVEYLKANEADISLKAFKKINY